MTSRIILIITLPLILSFGKPSDPGELYIQTHLELAKKESRRSGIPVSIKLAQALVESGNGNSILASRANNHFGIKCKSSWTGPRYFYTDDDRDEYGNLVPSCFRMYPTPEDSYRDHSDFLMASMRYDSLFQLDSRDYQGWAEGLRLCGYATDPRYTKSLLKKIEQYKLYNYD
jgi:flagellum-specific peptidoglycan hydrolase FlgJ